MDNYTRTRNDFLIAIISSPLSKNEIRAILFIFRASEGCRREKALLIPRDFITIGIQESQIGSLLRGLSAKELIYWDKENKMISINYEKLIETASYDEDRLAGILSKNLRKHKAKTYVFDKNELISSLSMDRPFCPAESQETQPKDNKEQLKRKKIDVEEQKRLIREGLGRVNKGEKYNNLSTSHRLEVEERRRGGGGTVKDNDKPI